MKKYILAAALVLASTSVMADSTVSGVTKYPARSKADACQQAKVAAAGYASSDEQVERYSKCDCDQDKKGDWSCSVDANLEKIH